MDPQQSRNAPSVTASEVNKEMRQIETEFNQGLQEIRAVKQKLTSVIECYKYLLDKTNKAKVDQAIREEISVLEKYRNTQRQMIERLEQKSAENEYAAIAFKIPKLSAELQ
jgi:vacuolar-type H+-ATPase subunit I/STV1